MDKIFAKRANGTIGENFLMAKLYGIVGSLQSLDWNSGLKWWNGMVELQVQQKMWSKVAFFFFFLPVRHDMKDTILAIAFRLKFVSPSINTVA